MNLRISLVALLASIGLILILTLARPTPAAELVAVPGTVAKIVDGDTLDATVADGSVVRVRVLEINTGETTLCKRKLVSSCAWCPEEQAVGLAAKQLVMDLLPPGEHITLWAQARPDRYGRVLARVAFQSAAGTTDLGAFLVSRGLAVPYDGGTKTRPWCVNS